MCCAQPDIISFDAHEGLDLFFTDWHALDFMQQGGTVAYGIVPTRPGVNAVDSASIFIRWLKAASLAGDPQKFAQRAMITATCGLGLLDTSAVAESFSVAHSVSKLIRSLAGSPEQWRCQDGFHNNSRIEWRALRMRDGKGCFVVMICHSSATAS